MSLSYFSETDYILAVAEFSFCTDGYVVVLIVSVINPWIYDN